MNAQVLKAIIGTTTLKFLGITDPWSSDSDLSDLSPVEDEYAKVDKSERRRQRDAPDIGDVTITAINEDTSVPATNTVTAIAAAVTTAVAPTPAAVPTTTVYQTAVYESPATVTALPTTATDTL